MIKVLFLDIGGVLLTNGWDQGLRARTAAAFQIEPDDMNARHQMVFDTYERGWMTFDEYLAWTIFYKKRDFSLDDVKKYILDAARPFHEMIALIQELKNQYHLTIGAVSNEGRELAADRVARFDLRALVDFFIISACVHYRKPDREIYQLAIDSAQVAPEQIVYIDDRAILVEIARSYGLQGIHHEEVPSTKAALLALLTQNYVRL